MYTKAQDLALLLARLITAVIFLHAGIIKWGMWSLTPEATGMAPWLLNVMKLLAVVEPLGAAALILGFLTRLASAGLAIILLGAIWVTQFIMGMGFVTATGPGWSFPFVMLAGCFVLMAFGAGNYSVDSMWHRRLDRPIGA